jgi:2',3'-cyclic-nucleotide 2'-phosphodiesterase/3'-nucleotidase
VAGPVSLPRVSSLLANPDEVWAVSKLSGSALRGALEYAVHSAPLPSTSFLQVSGLTFAYDPNAPRGKRVSNIRVGGNDLRDNGTYRVAMPLSLARGGSGYFKYFPKDNIEPPSQQSLAAAIVQFAGASSDPVSYTGAGRITRQ